MSIHALRVHTFSSLFGIGISQFFDRARAAKGQHFQLCLHDGVSVCCKSELKFNPALAHAPYLHHTPAPSTAYEKRKVEQKPLSSLRYLDTGDPQVATVIQKLRIIQGRDIPIMILGETGTGKDLLAQAIHHDSTRSHKNFVSINCASIPENLIESELFGYEEGAFTGAKRKGSIGKVLMAHEGTLFLDEIGDMPLYLQARLLRVLQERKVNPLGSAKETAVDIAIICATHKNLKDMIANGSFREDLYYRLNGLVVKLPALRERKDLEVVAKKILASVSGGEKHMGISPDVMAVFHRYAWPGNFRQLFNLLRTAAVMAEGETCIERHHLPDDFLSDIETLAVSPVSPSVTSASAWLASSSTSSPTPQDASTREPSPQTRSLETVAIDAIAQALHASNGNVSAAAKRLGVSRNTIYRKKHLLPAQGWN